MRKVVAILHNIRSIHNVGSMFRTADGAGIEKLYLTGITPSPLDRLGHYDPKFVKVSLGAERIVPWEVIRSTRAIRTLIDSLKKDEFHIYAVEQHHNSVPYNYPVERSLHRLVDGVALIMGDEVSGLQPSMLKRADEILEIPMRGKKESLNVSVAFGIVAYEFTAPRRRPRARC